MNRLRVLCIIAFILFIITIEAQRYKLYEIKQKLTEIQKLQAKTLIMEHDNEELRKDIQNLYLTLRELRYINQLETGRPKNGH